MNPIMQMFGIIPPERSSLFYNAEMKNYLKFKEQLDDLCDKIAWEVLTEGIDLDDT